MTTPAMMPEWPVPVDVSTIDDAPRLLSIEAEPERCVALAKRFDLPWITSLSAQVSLFHRTDGIIMQGNLQATLAQRCVATGEDLPVQLAIPFMLRFIPQSQMDNADADEIELDTNDCDTIGYSGHDIDIGEALADTLYLALDPFPRSPDAEKVLKAAGVISEGEAGPFGALAGLLKK